MSSMINGQGAVVISSMTDGQGATIMSTMEIGRIKNVKLSYSFSTFVSKLLNFLKLIE